MNLPAYPKYKDSGVAWLGKVPEGWEVVRLAHGFSNMGSGTTPPSDDPTWYDGDIPWVTTSELRERIIEITNKNVTMEALNTFSALKVFPKGTLLIAMYGATIGRLGILATEAATNQACCAMYGERRLCVQFAFYWCQAAKEFIILLASGGGQPNISQEKIRSLRVAAPPLPEQQAIAAFLDCETAKIDALVEKQRRMLDLLKEKRTALISHAVTKGLNPNAKLKESGVAWLGMVPEGWEVKKLRHVSRFKGGSTPSTDEAIYWEEGVIPWISPKDMKGASISQTEDYLTPTGANQCASGILNPDHVLIVVRSGILRHTIPVAINTVPACINQDIRAFILKDSKSSEYFKWFILGNQRALIDIWCKQGTTVESIEMNYLKDSCIAIPLLPEQKAIAAFLDRETAKIDTLAARIEDMIAKLQEYRTALITAAVTGKVDVRTTVEST